jgi:aminoglycoside phosphotransferase (APT) family kinase protein
MPWLKQFKDPRYARVIAANFAASWPVVIDRFGDDLSPAIRAFGERFPSLVGWYASEFNRPPSTFLHGDLRLDQLFFAVEPDDPPMTALDWQISSIGRGAYDLAYFLSQSLTTEKRRGCEKDLVARYAERLSERGIDYATEELNRDYRLTAAWCFAYPVIGVGRFDVANDRQNELLRVMLNGAAAAIEDHDALAVRPD